MVVKKYGNRRLYDTEASRYVTLEELAARIRGGVDVQVIDAKTGADLTQSTLAQVILESRGAARLLPVPLLKQLIRMGDDALAEFFGRYVAWALEVYLQMRQGAQAILPFTPLGAPLAMLGPLSRLLGSVPVPWSTVAARPVVEVQDGAEEGAAAEPPLAAAQEELAALRREVEALKRSIHRRRRR
ncbi:MAG TPA: polyhydroxyalkanoate synthesis regulator DNA-binding domain-containing protein [Candidatus Nanopelagicales bacterium]|nr:polyhydroxyalkanoate synthesis regulator DNA-binding domain-containing protein [Candidatus Nanopelagicales bacterium]